MRSGKNILKNINQFGKHTSIEGLAVLEENDYLLDGLLSDPLFESLKIVIEEANTLANS